MGSPAEIFMAKVKYYGVKRGLVPGVYTSWDECKAQVDGFSGAEYKSFKTEEEANDYVNIEKDNVDDKNSEKDNVQALIDMGICYTAVLKSESKSKEPVEPDVSKSDDDLDKPYAFVDGSFNPDILYRGMDVIQKWHLCEMLLVKLKVLWLLFEKPRN